MSTLNNDEFFEQIEEDSKLDLSKVTVTVAELKEMMKTGVSMGKPLLRIKPKND